MQINGRVREKEKTNINDIRFQYVRFMNRIIKVKSQCNKASITIHL